MPKIFPTIYPGITNAPRETVHRINTEVLHEDIRTLRMVFIDNGCTSYLVQRIISQTARYARKHNIDFSNAEQFFEFIRQRTDFESLEEGLDSNDGGRKAGVREGTPTNASLPTEPREETPTGKVGGGRGRGDGNNGIAKKGPTQGRGKSSR